MTKHVAATSFTLLDLTKKRLIAIVAGALTLAVCGHGLAADEPAASPAMDVAAGRQLYDRACAACHSGADDTAPPFATLVTYSRDRIATALSDTGLMKLQAKALTEEQRRSLVTFLTAPGAGGGNGTSLVMTAKEEYRPGFSYPVRSARDPRDGSSVARPPAWAAPKLGSGPFDFESWEQRKLQASVVVQGLEAPRAMAFLPDGSIFVIERAGALRIVRGGKLDPTPIAGTPVVATNLGIATGFMDVVLHPDFQTNGLVYFSYHKPRDDLGVNAIYRGRWNGKAIVDGKDIFVSPDVDTFYSRMTFGADGKLYASIGGPALGTDASLLRAQQLNDYGGKILRLNDDGSAPSDNPFVGRQSAKPEIFTLGHRINLGIAMNPWTKEIWATENAPYGGDEVNILRGGQNYGWPIVSDGRFYGGSSISPVPFKEGITRPHLTYVPSIAPGGLAFYTGDKFPAWKGNLFIAALRMGEAPRTGHIERVVFNDKWEPVRNEMLLLDLHQRIRDVKQSPDGYLYVITDEGADSVLLKLEPGK